MQETESAATQNQGGDIDFNLVILSCFVLFFFLSGLFVMFAQTSDRHQFKWHGHRWNVGAAPDSSEALIHS